MFPSHAGKLPEGFFTPVIAFEFVQSEEEVNLLFYKADDPEACRAAMDKGNRLDFVFMGIYGSFLFLFAFIRFVKEKSTAYMLAMILAVIAALFDVFENQQLLILSGNPLALHAESAIGILVWFVHLKFGALVLYFLCLLPIYWQFSFAGKVMSIVAPITLILFIVAIFNRGLANEIMVYGLAILFLSLAISAWIAALRKEAL